jgi:hypothetical protein
MESNSSSVLSGGMTKNPTEFAKTYEHTPALRDQSSGEEPKLDPASLEGASPEVVDATTMNYKLEKKRYEYFTLQE